MLIFSVNLGGTVHKLVRHLLRGLVGGGGGGAALR